jgi:ADP-heptose:LPS heptosyltransferase
MATTSQPLKIAVFRSCGIGDFVQLTPLLAQIRSNLPSCRLFFFSNESIASIAASHPALTKFVAIPNQALTQEAGRWGCWKAWSSVRSHAPFDYLLSFEPTWKRNLGSLLVSSPRKFGIQTTGSKAQLLFTDLMYYEKDGPKPTIHMSQIYLNAWSQLTGFTDSGLGYDLRYLPRTTLSAPEPEPPFVALAPGSGNFISPGTIKRWPVENWIALGNALLAKKYPPIWLGSAPDQRRFPSELPGLNCMGSLTLLESIEIVRQSSLVIANDTGLLHAAAALEVPIIGLYGPTGSYHTGPFRTNKATILSSPLPCVPCWKETCNLNRDTDDDPALAACLQALSPQVVESAAISILSS